MEGRCQASIERDKSNLALAWHVEAFARSKRLPKLEKLLRQIERQKLPEQTPDDMLEVLRSIDGGQGMMSFKFIPNGTATEG